MTITSAEATRLMNFGLFLFLRQNGYSEENLAEGIEFAKSEFCTFCEAEGIEEVEDEEEPQQEEPQTHWVGGRMVTDNEVERIITTCPNLHKMDMGQCLSCRYRNACYDYWKD